MSELFSDDISISNFDEARTLIEECRRGFFQLFDNSPACISITTLDRIYVRANKKFLNIFGFSQEEIIGKNSLEIGILEEVEFKRVAAILKEKGCLQNEMVTCKSSTNEYVYTISSIEKIESEGELFFVSTFLDVTQMIEQQRTIALQHQEMLDSINYARHIQNAILPSEQQIEEILPQSFILAKPKNIVSGDFYWLKKQGNKIFVAACDCTGHGVPGAFISIVGYKLLDKFIDEYNLANPADILNQLNKEYSNADTSLTESNFEIGDGMDIALCAVDTETMHMAYAGAYNPVYLVRNGVLKELAVDKISIHLFKNSINQDFTNYDLKMQSGDIYYIFSDGYVDQFGGPLNKKFLRKNFKELILSVYQLPMKEQKLIFEKTIENWKSVGEQEQTDDILIIGFKI